MDGNMTGGARLTIRDLAGASYARWVMASSAVACVAYGLTSSTAIALMGRDAFPGVMSEVLACIAAGIGVAVSRRRPSAAASLVLVAVWTELQYGFWQATDLRPIGMLATPALVAAAGILVGTRWAFTFAATSAILTPVLILSSPLVRFSIPLHPEIVREFLAYASVLFGMWMLVSLGLRSFGRALALSAASEALLAETIRLAPDGILIVGADQRLLSINPAAERVLAMNGAARIGHEVGNLLDTAGVDPEQRAALGSARTSPAPVALALHQSARGSVFVEVAIGQMAEGRQQWLLRDVTERVRAEEDRQTMQIQLANTQRLEAIGRLAGGIAHDFNNLLTVIGGSADLLRDGVAREDDRALVEDIMVAHERGATLVRQLLAFARHDIIQPGPLDLGQRVLELRRLLERAAGERVRFEFLVASGGWILSDVSQIELLLVNLVTNARDAMPEGGAARIAVELVTDQSGQWVRLSVTDAGIGMDEATRGRAFDPFFTTKPRGKGTGLGLASVHGIVHQSGGRATIQSAPGNGTTVVLEFPRVSEPPDSRSPGAEQQASTPPRKATVLLADDDDGVRSTAQRILARAGYAVVAAADGEAALREAEHRGEPFDLLLTDVIMPGLTGPQLALRLRTRWPGLPVLFMSGYPEDALVEIPDLSISRDFVAKPFTPTVLRDRVREMLERLPSATAKPDHPM